MGKSTDEAYKTRKEGEINVLDAFKSKSKYHVADKAIAF